jgi:spore coat polysaccharide biosynthesis protein SpsF
MKSKKIVASIEARMTSSRLPGKVLMKAVDNISMLQFMIERIKQSKYINEIIVATTINGTDNSIIELCKKINIKYYRGSEEDVLLRVLEAHQSVNSDIVVELTGDCPLIDPDIIDLAISTYLNNNADYVSNAHIRSFPDGLDVQVFSFNLLAEIAKKAVTKNDRENVSSFIYESGKYKLKEIIADKAIFWPDLRITLDDNGDYDLIANIIQKFYPNNKFNFSAYDIVKYIRSNPDLLELNRNARVNVVSSQKLAKNNE